MGLRIIIKKKIDEIIPAQFISNHCSKISSCIKKASQKKKRKLKAHSWVDLNTTFP